jgi:Ca-activated chloride channel family protein
MDWTRNVSEVRSLFSRLKMRGATPTGPAIFKVLEYYRYDKLNGHRDELRSEDDEAREGMIGGYVV